MGLSLEVAILVLTFHQILNVIVILSYPEMVYIYRYFKIFFWTIGTNIHAFCLSITDTIGMLMSAFTIEATFETVSIICLK